MTILKGEKIYFRRLTEEDATKRYCQWLNDPEVNKYLETKSATVAGIREYIKAKNRDPKCLFFGIFSRKDNRHIGNFKLDPIDLKEKKAFFGLLIGDKSYWGMGIGTEATKVMADYCFNKLNLNRVEAAMISKNVASFKIHQKLGFKVDKTENDIISMSVEKKSWKAQNK